MPSLLTVHGFPAATEKPRGPVAALTPVASVAIVIVHAVPAARVAVPAVSASWAVAVAEPVAAAVQVVVPQVVPVVIVAALISPREYVGSTMVTLSEVQTGGVAALQEPSNSTGTGEVKLKATSDGAPAYALETVKPVPLRVAVATAVEMSTAAATMLVAWASVTAAVSAVSFAAIPAVGVVTP